MSIVRPKAIVVAVLVLSAAFMWYWIGSQDRLPHGMAQSQPQSIRPINAHSARPAVAEVRTEVDTAHSAGHTSGDLETTEADGPSESRVIFRNGVKLAEVKRHLDVLNATRLRPERVRLQDVGKSKLANPRADSFSDHLRVSLSERLELLRKETAAIDRQLALVSEREFDNAAKSGQAVIEEPKITRDSTGFLMGVTSEIGVFGEQTKVEKIGEEYRAIRVPSAALPETASFRMSKLFKWANFWQATVMDLQRESILRAEEADRILGRVNNYINSVVPAYNMRWEELQERRAQSKAGGGAKRSR